MFKYLITVLAILILTPLATTNAQTTTPDPRKLAECIQGCVAKDTSTDNASTKQLRCQNQCRQEQNGREYLPPINKPDLLPGPTFNNEQQRTGQEVTNFISLKLLPKTANRLITVVAITSMLGLIYAGITYFTAIGDTEKSGKGKNIAIYAIVGLVISLLSFAIVQIISNLPLTTT